MEKITLELEQDTIINILSKNKYSIISLGGGSFLNIKTREYIKKNVLVFGLMPTLM